MTLAIGDIIEIKQDILTGRKRATTKKGMEFYAQSGDKCIIEHIRLDVLILKNLRTKNSFPLNKNKLK